MMDINSTIACTVALMRDATYDVLMDADADSAQLLDELAGLYGILPGFWDMFGVWHGLTTEGKKAILSAMKLDIGSASEIVREIQRKKTGYWTSFLDPVHVISEHDQPFSLPVYIPVDEGLEGNMYVSYYIENELGSITECTLQGGDLVLAETAFIYGERYIKVLLTDTHKRDIGYYQVAVTAGNCRDGSGVLQKNARVIIAPETCYLPDESCDRGSWGLAVNLYSVRSTRNWGVGDFGDLREIVSHVGDLNGDFVGLPPLHAIPNTKPYGLSPYSPISRLYLNIIYLDMDAVPDIAESASADSLLNRESFRSALKDLRDSPIIDYEKAAELKLTILRHAFDHFYENHYLCGAIRGKDFRSYLSEEGEALRTFSLYLALRRHFIQSANLYDWHAWPDQYRRPDRDAVGQFRDDHEKDVLFHCYVQWLLDRQLTEIQKLCRQSGMKTGIYHDLAIGAVNGGSDIWMYQDVAGGADVGAPPDDFNPSGQNWGFPVLVPHKLKETGYELFIQTLRKNMRRGGALRIDHALGLFRIFWIPAGMQAKDGGYVLQPSIDLLRIIALESRRNRTVIIAEDLGTMDEEFRSMLQQFRMLSYRLFYFERNYPDPSFTPPGKYSPMALSAVTTHDLPTLYGYWEGHDIEVKKRLGIYPDEAALERDRSARRRDRGLMLSALKAENLLPADISDDPSSVPRMTPELCSAVYRYLAATPCRLVLVSLDDIIGTIDQPNMPGTVDQHPNWVQKTSLMLDVILKDKRFLGLRDCFSALPGQ